LLVREYLDRCCWSSDSSSVAESGLVVHGLVICNRIDCYANRAIFVSIVPLRGESGASAAIGTLPMVEVGQIACTWAYLAAIVS